MVYEVVALRTSVGVFEVLDDTRLAECVQALRHGSGVDKVTMADLKAYSFHQTLSTSRVTYWHPQVIYIHDMCLYLNQKSCELWLMFFALSMHALTYLARYVLVKVAHPTPLLHGIHRCGRGCSRRCRLSWSHGNEVADFWVSKPKFIGMFFFLV